MGRAAARAPGAAAAGGDSKAKDTLYADRDFIYVDDDEPHAARRTAILKAHPEVKKLMGYEWRTKYMVFATVLLQVFCAWLTIDWGWTSYLLVVYVVGATANQACFLAIHELSHNLGASTTNGNRAIAFISNLPIGIPYSANFKPYHMLHHKYQGDPSVDTDIPSLLEARLVTSTATCRADHVLRKAIFMFFQIFAYALRPTMMKPDAIKFDLQLLLNWITQVSFDALVIYWLGLGGMLYFLLSTFLAGSIHPVAGHFLAEHYVTDGEAETYSYYGPLNYVAYNVGYHNEHHDFANIPWSRIAELHRIAHEFYDDLPQCKSWTGIVFDYIFNDSLGPYSRVKRCPKKAT